MLSRPLTWSLPFHDWLLQSGDIDLLRSIIDLKVLQKAANLARKMPKNPVYYYKSSVFLSRLGSMGSRDPSWDRNEFVGYV